MVDTWALSGGPYTSIKMNATDNDSGSASLLMDLQVGTASQASIDKRGTFSFAAPASGTAPSRPGIGNWYGSLGIFGSGGTLALSISSASVNTGTSYQFSWNADTILSRRALANLRLGAADAAAPVAQTLSVQSVVAGTSNTAGPNLTITGSQSTGSGVGGSIIFQTAVANSGGGATVQNTLANAMVIDSVKTVRLGTGYTVATLPAAGTAGRRTYVTDATVPTFLGTLTGGGAVVCPVFDNGTAWVSA